MSGERGLLPGEPHLYVLRVWFERDGPTAVWRASLLYDRDTRRYFSSPPALLQFLENSMSTEPTLSHAACTDE